MTSHGHGEVYLDDVLVPKVIGVSFVTGVDRTNEVRLTLIPEEIDISSIASTSREFVYVHPAPFIPEDPREAARVRRELAESEFRAALEAERLLSESDPSDGSTA